MCYFLYRESCATLLFCGTECRGTFFTPAWILSSVFPNRFQSEWCQSVQDCIKILCISFLEVQKPLTNGAVVPFPSWAALTLPILALPVLGTVGVAGPFFTGGSHPALLTLAYPSGADAVAATVQGTQLCTEKTKVHHMEQHFHTANRLCIKTNSLLYEYHSSAGSNMGF